MIRAIAIDDEPLGLKIISHFCENCDVVSLEKTFTKQSEALSYIKNHPIDLIFLDIQMPNRSGVDFYKMLENNPMVIFTTAYSEYAVEGFNVNAIDYLLKPFSEERFLTAVTKAKNQFQFRQNVAIQTHLMVRADYKLYRIQYEDIIMIEGLDDYVQIHLLDKSKIVARLSMKGILEKLPENDFIRVHRSFIISRKKVKTIVSKNIQIENFIIPIGDTFKENVLALFT